MAGEWRGHGMAGGGKRGILRRPRWRVSFGRLACVLLLLAYAPALLFLFRTRLISLFQGKQHNCDWLHHPPLACAHGGDSIRAPPNTLEAFRLALESRVDCIEIDASRTRDGVLVALHDSHLQKIYGHGTVKVGDLTWNEIRKLNAGRGYSLNELVPTLRDALQSISGLLKQVIVDVKVGPPLFEVSLAADILSVVNETRCRNCLVWSKADNLVQDVKQLSPEVMAGYIVMNDPVTGKASDILRMKNVEVVGLYHGLATERIVSDIHSVGKKAHVWTVNDKESMKKMLNIQVDCIVTSYPSELQELMAEMKQHCKEAGKE